jgi:hypothetical protein
VKRSLSLSWLLRCFRSRVSAECTMSPAFDRPDEDDTTTAVWQDLSKAALLFADGLKVNTDGTRVCRRLNYLGAQAFRPSDLRRDDAERCAMGCSGAAG